MIKRLFGVFILCFLGCGMVQADMQKNAALVESINSDIQDTERDLADLRTRIDVLVEKENRTDVERNYSTYLEGVAGKLFFEYEVQAKEFEALCVDMDAELSAEQLDLLHTLAGKIVLSRQILALHRPSLTSKVALAVGVGAAVAIGVLTYLLITKNTECCELGDELGKINDQINGALQRAGSARET